MEINVIDTINPALDSFNKPFKRGLVTLVSVNERRKEGKEERDFKKEGSLFEFEAQVGE